MLGTCGTRTWWVSLASRVRAQRIWGQCRGQGLTKVSEKRRVPPTWGGVRRCESICNAQVKGVQLDKVAEPEKEVLCTGAAAACTLI